MRMYPPKNKKIANKSRRVCLLYLGVSALVTWLVLLAVAANVLTLFLPKFIASAIDTYIQGSFDLSAFAIKFGTFSIGIFFFTYLQSIAQTYASERVARDLRMELVNKISKQGYRFIEERDPSKLLTNITSDIDSIKLFVAQAVVSLVSSAVIIIGVIVILLSINWKLALAVLTIIPVISGTFFVILSKVRALFLQSREVIDRLNKVINESILGSALVRVLHSENFEYQKFTGANDRARSVGISILKLFSFMIPIITFTSSMGALIVMTLGGLYVTEDTMSIGSFAAFNSYIFILIFPILVIGFMSNIIAQANASYTRIHEVLSLPDAKDKGTTIALLGGSIELKNVSVLYGEKCALKNVSLTILPHSKTAILGPTAAGKTQLLNVLTGLTFPKEGSVEYDGRALSQYERESFYSQIGIVFQDSVLFNTTVRENIAFSTTVTDASLEKAIQTAELVDMIDSLPQGLEKIVTERGTSLSGGQKQRLMLARALAIEPKILFLDDFTARVDGQTERKILTNIVKNYPNMTLISITQKIAPIKDYDQIILLMEGELLAHGTHEELMRTTPEYVQIYDSQRSTNAYELRT